MSAFKSAGLAGALLAGLVVATPIQAQEVEGVDVRALAPTTVVIQTRGLSVGQVRLQVRQAAQYVCANAVDNREVDLLDEGWCAFHAADKAMGRYRRALRSADTRLASGPVALIVRS